MGDECWLTGSTAPRAGTGLAHRKIQAPPTRIARAIRPARAMAGVARAGRRLGRGGVAVVELSLVVGGDRVAPRSDTSLGACSSDTVRSGLHVMPDSISP